MEFNVVTVKWKVVFFFSVFIAQLNIPMTIKTKAIY